jgi:hypothetical protein
MLLGRRPGVEDVSGQAPLRDRWHRQVAGVPLLAAARAAVEVRRPRNAFRVLPAPTVAARRGTGPCPRPRQSPPGEKRATPLAVGSTRVVRSRPQREQTWSSRPVRSAPVSRRRSQTCLHNRHRTRPIATSTASDLSIGRSAGHGPRRPRGRQGPRRAGRCGPCPSGLAAPVRGPVREGPLGSAAAAGERAGPRLGALVPEPRCRGPSVVGRRRRCGTGGVSWTLSSRSRRLPCPGCSRRGCGRSGWPSTSGCLSGTRSSSWTAWSRAG